MLKLIPRDRLKAKINGHIPTENPDAPEFFELTATWKVLKTSEFKALMSSKKTEMEAVKENLIDLEGLCDEAGKEIKFKPAMLDELFEITPVKDALVKSLASCQTVEGQKAALVKN